MTLKEVLSAVSGILTIFCLIPYILSIIAKKTKPMKATWLIWASLDTVIFWGMFLEGGANGQIFVSVFGSWLIFFLSLRYGAPKWTWLDKICLAILVVSILAMIFGNNLISILACLLANCVGAIPTCCSVWEDYRREPRFTWLLATIASFCALASVSTWKIEHVAQPLTFIIIQVPIVYLLFVRKAVPSLREIL